MGEPLTVEQIEIQLEIGYALETILNFTSPDTETSPDQAIGQARRLACLLEKLAELRKNKGSPLTSEEIYERYLVNIAK